MPWDAKSEKQKRLIYAAAARGETWAIQILKKEGKPLPTRKGGKALADAARRTSKR